MSYFEKITKIDDSFNGHASREKVFNIEKSDEDYKLIYRPPAIADEKILGVRLKNAKNQSKIPKGKISKNNPKRYKGTVAPLQE